MMTMTADSTSGGLDVENPIGTAPTSSGDSSSAGIGRKKKWGLMSAFLLVVGVVAVSVGLTLGGGGGKSAVEKYTSSSTDNAGKTSINHSCRQQARRILFSLTFWDATSSLSNCIFVLYSSHPRPT